MMFTDAYCDTLEDKAAPLEEKAVQGLAHLPGQVHRAVLVQRVVDAVRGGAEPDQAGGVPASPRRFGPSRAMSPSAPTAPTSSTEIK